MTWLIGLISALFKSWFAVKQADTTARDAGANQANANASIEAAKSEADIAQAVTDAPKTRDDVVSKLREGKF